MQRYYELMMVITPQADEEELSASLEKVNRYISQRGGTVIRQQRWGNVRRLAYPIKNHREGSYVLTHLQMEPRYTGELESDIQVSEEILRHLLVKVDKIPEPLPERPQASVAREEPPTAVAGEQAPATVGELAPAMGEVVPEEPGPGLSGEEATERKEPGQ